MLLGFHKARFQLEGLRLRTRYLSCLDQALAKKAGMAVEDDVGGRRRFLPAEGAAPGGGGGG